MIEFTTAAAPVEASYTEKRSEFIGQLFPVSDAAACQQIIDSVRAKHHKARHNVWAYRLRSGDVSRYSDDGEPQGTGGIPVLSVLQKAGLTDVLIVVTRYFGGVLLGASGLTRAYTEAAARAAQAAEKLHYCEAFRVRLQTEYGMYGKVSYLLPEYGVIDAGSDFGEQVSLLFDIRTDRFPALSARLTELFGGDSGLETLETHFAVFPAES
ncbi:MAG: YigZ family protein [Oscillospiraceae bacterium]|nr:YigZ family protein [Oscillospiraceae bacterium]